MDKFRPFTPARRHSFDDSMANTPQNAAKLLAAEMKNQIKIIKIWKTKIKMK